MPTKSMAAAVSFAARTTWRPMRPNPLIPTFNVIGKSPLVLSGSPVAARACPAERHEADDTCAGVEERGGACVECGARSQHVVHQHDMLAAHSPPRAGRANGHRERL